MPKHTPKDIFDPRIYPLNERCLLEKPSTFNIKTLFANVKVIFQKSTLLTVLQQIRNQLSTKNRPIYLYSIKGVFMPKMYLATRTNGGLRTDTHYIPAS